MDAVDRVEVKFNSGKIEMDHDRERAPAELLVETVRGLGYESRVSRF